MAEADRPPDPLRELVHDLRSPLAIIDGFSALLERDDGSLDLAKRIDYAERIRAAAADMRAQIDGAVTFIDHGRQDR
jgi:signal transduction histidine kinase